MKALVQNGYGSADVLSVGDPEKPSPGDDEVLVRVHTASLNIGDVFGMRGSPYVARFSIGWPTAKGFIPGWDAAGTVEAVGAKVTDLRAGDEVFGEPGNTCAEYTSSETGTLAVKPAAVTFEQAAAMPTAGCTALQGLRDWGELTEGEHVLVNGASGGVGTFAVQIAKALGAEVTGVCSARNEEMVRSIGADHTIDYKTEDFTKGEARYDLILDLVASHPASDCRRVLTPAGRHVPSSGHAGLGWIASASMTAMFDRRQVRPRVTQTNRADLEYLAGLVEEGKLDPVIDRRYALSEAVEAFAYLDEGHAQGKTIIQVESV
jgi:NADPH:quinone reductase-like Zn-dependent oxidoreductase